jgi:hypothetical protein
MDELSDVTQLKLSQRFVHRSSKTEVKIGKLISQENMVSGAIAQAGHHRRKEGIRLRELISVEHCPRYQLTMKRPECPDSPRCQALLDEKWRQAHQAVCRYGPPQPSVAFR